MVPTAKTALTTNVWWVTPSLEAVLEGVTQGRETETPSADVQSNVVACSIYKTDEPYRYAIC